MGLTLCYSTKKATITHLKQTWRSRMDVNEAKPLYIHPLSLARA